MATAWSGTRELEELEVESVAYIVCDAIGLDRSDYSFAYVARWSEGFTELVKDTAERVVECAKRILTALEDGITRLGDRPVPVATDA